MNDYSLCCNLPKCRVPLHEIAWVTRCLHVFCPGHGKAYFTNCPPQVNCPICNEINLKEVDILQCEINPSDMILAGLPPEKAITLASKSLKLWWQQMQEEQSARLSKVNYLEKKNNEMKYVFSKMLNKTKQKHELEINNLKMLHKNLTKKIDNLNKELVMAQQKLQEYKVSNSSRQRTKNMSSSLSLSPPHWLSNDGNVLFSPSPRNNNNRGFEFSFNDSHTFK